MFKLKLSCYLFSFTTRRISTSKINLMEVYKRTISFEGEKTGEPLTKEKSSMSLEDVVIDETPSTIVTEGKATISFPSSQDVFYNPVQEFNRDLSVAVMKQFVKTVPTSASGVYERLRKKLGSEIEINVLEALSASGLRSIRYAKEVEGLKEIIANDMSYQAYESILYNVRKNEVEHIVMPRNEDANLLMYRNKKTFDIVDLDPYGAPSPFLDAGVQAVVDGGLLMVTCTDMAVLCGNTPETCHAKYGATSAKVPYCHEMALRIVLQCIESSANRYGRYIEPILSVSADFYVRLFVRIFSGPAMVKKSVGKLSMAYICQGCKSFHLQPLGVQCPTKKGSKCSIKGPPVDRICNICNYSFKVCGPIWSANMHDKKFVLDMVKSMENDESQFNTSKRMLGMLNVILEELDDAPLFHKMDKLCSTVHVISPTLLQFRSALMHAGFKVSMSHTVPSSIKTNAPQHIIWDIVRAWAKLHPGKKTFESEPAKFIMNQDSSIEVLFELREDANPESRTNGLLRFQMNPEPHWGPRCRAKSSLYWEEPLKKEQRCENKKLRNANSSEEMDSDIQCKKLKSTDHGEMPNQDNQT